MKKRFGKALSQLSKYKPPFRDWRFWAIQVLSIGIAIAHSSFESFGAGSEFGRLYFVPIILLVVPVVIASLYFGFAGAITTALWVVVLTVPNLILEHTGLERIGEGFQMAVLIAMAVFMGRQVDNERNLRYKIEGTSNALASSETKYHSLFSSSPVPILALNQDNVIIDANPSAGLLFGKSPDALKNMTINNLIEAKSKQEKPASLKANNWWESPLIIVAKDGSEIHLEPSLTRLNDNHGNPIIQVVLKDITEERRRQAGLKAYTAYVIQAQEDERQHIARELHDEMLQNLALLCRQLKGIEISGEVLPSAVAEDVGKARDMAEKAVKELRAFTRSLRPPILDDLGLVASIRRLALDFTDRSGIKGQFKVIGEEYRLPKDVEVHLFRIAQEALWNVEHHSQAANASVVISFDREETILDISDDGIGFTILPNLEVMSRSGKLGLLGMKERAELFGGKLEIKSSLGQGTNIRVTFPTLDSVKDSQPVI